MDATSRTPMRLALTRRLFDDASMYPPARAPMEAALALHRTVAASPWAVAQGRFLCPAGQLHRLPKERDLLGLSSPLEVAAVVGSPADPGATAHLSELQGTVLAMWHRSPEVRVSAVELRPADSSEEALDRATEQLVELALATGMDQAAIELGITDLSPSEIARRLEVVATSRARHGAILCAKVRCGGLAQEMVPSVEALATFVHACVQHGLAFKATAGLHHALARMDAERRHGYLNLVAAAAMAHTGGTVDDVAAMLRMDQPAAVGLGAEELTFGSATFRTPDIDRTRREAFLSFGTCSFIEPLSDVLELP